MTLGPGLLLRDQFGSRQSRGGRGLLWSEFAFIAIPLIPAGLVFYFKVQSPGVSGLLTATSILTGLTFTMTMRFWDRSIEILSKPEFATNGRMLYVTDKMRSHLVWTVLVGVVATGYLAVTVIFMGSTLPTWSVAVMAFLCLYLVCLVGGAIIRFYELSYLLRP